MILMYTYIYTLHRKYTETLEMIALKLIHEFFSYNYNLRKNRQLESI